MSVTENSPSLVSATPVMTMAPAIGVRRALHSSRCASAPADLRRAASGANRRSSNRASATCRMLPTASSAAGATNAPVNKK